MEMRVVSGKIDELYMQSDFLGRTDTTLLEKMISGVRHDPFFIEEKLKNEEHKLSTLGITREEMNSLFL